MPKDQKTTAATDLTQAAAEAVAEQEQQTQEEQVQEETQEQVAEADKPAEELNGDGLPKDHKERSDLGRKVSAVHRRMDEMDNKFERLITLLEASNQRKDPLDDVEEDAPITRKDLERWESKRREETRAQEKKYNDSYVKTVAGLGSDLGQDEYEAIIAEMQTITYNPTEDAAKDAEINFYKAERAYLRKQLVNPKKQNPLKGGDLKGKIAVATTQKNVVSEKAAPKLDSDAQSYVDFVRRRSGDEKAQSLLKDL